MAEKAEKQTARELVAALAQRLKTPAWALAGCRMAYGWRDDTELTQAEYEQALRAWLAAPMGRSEEVK